MKLSENIYVFTSFVCADLKKPKGINRKQYPSSSFFIYALKYFLKRPYVTNAIYSWNPSLVFFHDEIVVQCMALAE